MAPLTRLLWMALVVSLAIPASARQLEELRGEIQESRERVGQHEADERELLELLEGVERSLDRLNREVSKASAEADAAHGAFRNIRQRSDELAAKLERTRRSLSRRAVALYKQGEVGAVRVLFSADSLGELLSRWGSLRTLVRTDAALAERFRQEHQQFDASLRELEQAAEQRELTAEHLRLRSRELAAERAHKRKLVRRVHTDRVEERAFLIELERAAHTLEETLAALGDSASVQQAPAASNFAFGDRRGSLPAPVLAPIRVGFGRVVDARFKTETFRRGVEFDAAMGDPVRAVAPGVVRFEGWFRGYGKMVVVDHGGEYFTVSGHLSEIEVKLGQQVRSGEALGAVGETGSLVGPSLYFEIRRGGEPLDPSDWLVPPERARDSA